MLATTLMLATSPALADGAAGDMTVRALVGFSHTDVAQQRGDRSTSISGFGTLVEAAVGGRLTDDLVLHATALLTVLPEDTVIVDGLDLWLLEHHTLIWGVGLGLSYELPYGFWVGADVRLGSLRPFASDFERNNIQGVPSTESDAGFIIDAMLGWNHPVADDLALGVATWLIYTTHPNDEATPWTGFTLGAAMTLHYR